MYERTGGQMDGQRDRRRDEQADSGTDRETDERRNECATLAANETRVIVFVSIRYICSYI